MVGERNQFPLVRLACICAITAACGDDPAPREVPPWTDLEQNVVIDGVQLPPDPFTSAIIRTAGEFTYVELAWHSDNPNMTARIALRLAVADVTASRPVALGSASVRIYAINSSTPTLIAWLASDDPRTTGEVRAHRSGGEMSINIRLDATMLAPGDDTASLHLEDTLTGIEETVSALKSPCGGHDEPVYVPMMFEWSNTWQGWQQAEERCEATTGVECVEMHFEVPCGAGDRYYCLFCHDTICVAPVFRSECLPTY